MTNPRLENFKRVILKNQAIPDDLLRLWMLHESHPLDGFARMGVKFIEPGRIPDLLSHAYLNDDDRANADIMRNIAAFDEVFELSTFVVELDDTSTLGYWHGPGNASISQAPILMLDTEGQFSIVPGRTLTEGLLGQALKYSDTSEVDDMLTWLAKHQISVGAKQLEDLTPPRVDVLPSEIHLRAYNGRRVSDGLPPI